MAYEQNVQCITVPAGADLSAKQYRFGTIAADGQVDPTGAGLLADGVIQDDPDTAGDACRLGIAGVSKVEAGDAVTMGDIVQSDSVGRAITTATDKQNLGRALAAATAAGDYIPVLLKFSGQALSL